MPINAKYSHRSEMTSNFWERFLNRKYVSGRWEANVHPNVHIYMQQNNISYDNVLYLIPRSVFMSNV